MVIHHCRGRLPRVSTALRLNKGALDAALEQEDNRQARGRVQTAEVVPAPAPYAGLA